MLLNQTFLAAGLKTCLSGIKVYQDAGYGGDAKAVLPGLAALPTVEYNHTRILTKVRTTGPVKVFRNDMRLDMIEAARVARVDYTVQILYNHRLRPTRIAKRNASRADDAHCDRRQCVADGLGEGDNLFRRHRERLRVFGIPPSTRILIRLDIGTSDSV